MAAGFTSYSVDNDKIFADALAEASRLADDLRVPLTLIAVDFYKSQRSIFTLQSEGQYDDLSELYKERKSRPRSLGGAGFVYPILKFSGKLEKAASVRGATGNITQVNKKTLTIGVKDSVIPYAKYHQTDKAGSRKIPLRKFLFIGPESSKYDTPQTAGRLERWISTLREHMIQNVGKPLGGKK